MIFLAVSGIQALAKERIVKLNIPGCNAWGNKHRIGTILKEIKGVSQYDFENKDFVTVTFEDTATSIKVITGELKKGGKEVKGKPVFLK